MIGSSKHVEAIEEKNGWICNYVNNQSVNKAQKMFYDMHVKTKWFSDDLSAKHDSPKQFTRAAWHQHGRADQRYNPLRPLTSGLNLQRALLKWHGIASAKSKTTWALKENCEKTTHVISKLWTKTAALATKNKSCDRNRLQKIVLHLVNRYDPTSNKSKLVLHCTTVQHKTARDVL